MPTNFPNTLDNFSNLLPGSSLDANNHTSAHNNTQDSIKAIEEKLGINNSAVTTSIDFLLKNASSINPGHKHTASNITDFDTAAANLLLSNTALTEAVQDAVGQALTDSPTIDFDYDDANNTIKADVVNNSSIQKIEVSQNNTLVGTRKRINFVDSSEIKINATEDIPNDRINVTASLGTFFVLDNASPSNVVPVTKTYNHGLGRVPKYIRLTASSYQGSTFGYSEGYWNDSTQECMYFGTTSYGTVNNKISYVSLNPNVIQCQVLSVDATQVILYFTNNTSVYFVNYWLFVQ